jgi:hypothetical protein
MRCSELGEAECRVVIVLESDLNAEQWKTLSARISTATG